MYTVLPSYSRHHTSGRPGKGLRPSNDFRQASFGIADPPHSRPDGLFANRAGCEKSRETLNQVLGEIPCLGYPLARMRRRGTRNGPCLRNDSVGRYRRAQGKEVVVRFVCPNKGLYMQILLHEMWKLWPDCEKGHPLLPHR